MILMQMKLKLMVKLMDLQQKKLKLMRMHFEGDVVGESISIEEGANIKIQALTKKEYKNVTLGHQGIFVISIFLY